MSYSDLSFDIKIDRQEYTAGQTVRGTLTILVNKGFKTRSLKFLAIGEERIVINDAGPWNYTEASGVFFSEDLSHLLYSTTVGGSSGVVSSVIDGTIEIAEGSYTIPFEFTIPDNAIESYNGKYSNLSYKLKAIADRTKRMDINKEISFTVHYNPSRISNTNSYKNLSLGFSAASLPNPLGIIGTHLFYRAFAKSRNYYNKQNMDAKFDLEYNNNRSAIGYGNNDNNNKKTFSPGETIKGKVVILEHLKAKGKKVKDIDITLSGIEHAVAQGIKRVAVLQKQYGKVEWNDKSMDHNIPFEIEIPKGAKRSYIANLSEYYWGLEAKLTIGWRSNTSAKTIIEVT